MVEGEPSQERDDGLGPAPARGDAVGGVVARGLEEPVDEAVVGIRAW